MQELKCLPLKLTKYDHVQNILSKNLLEQKRFSPKELSSKTKPKSAAAVLMIASNGFPVLQHHDIFSGKYCSESKVQFQ